MGPTARSSKQCINCFLLVSSPLSCPKCSLVLCSMECSTGTLHQAECDLLASIRTKVGEETWRQSLPSILACVTTIRLLSLQWRDPPTWSLVYSLINDKANESVWRIIKDAFDTVLHLDDRIKEEDLKYVFGIQSTNGANIHFKPGYGTGVGVFPIQAYLNHSCKSNTDTMEHPVDHSVHLYARTAIPAGTQLTTSYLQSSLPTRARRTQLFNTWNFWCSCPACQDSTEGGTFMSGIACSAKCGGPVISNNPLFDDSSWSCTACGHEISAHQAQVSVQTATKELEYLAKYGLDIDKLEHLVFQLDRLLCGTHHIMMEAQQKLLMAYMKGGVVTLPTITRKIQLCHNILDYMKKENPTEKSSKKYLSIRKYLIDSKLQAMAQEHKEGRLSQKKLSKIICEKQALTVMLIAAR